MSRTPNRDGATDHDPEYTIAVCNYNMAETVGTAVESMLEHTDERFEVLVVDDGSTDDSVVVVESVMADHDRVRLVELDADPDRTLGETRNVSVERAHGDHVLLQMDADDVYSAGIVDFVEAYEQLRAGLDFDFYLKGKSINVAPRAFLREYGPYRDLPVGAEDQDLWRRLFADDAIIWVEHASICREIGYERDRIADLRRTFGVRVGEFRAGVSFGSYLWWSYGNWRDGAQSPLGFCFDLVTLPLCYALAQTEETYSLPPEFATKAALHDAIDANRMTLSEVADRYDVDIDENRFAGDGRGLFS